MRKPNATPDALQIRPLDRGFYGRDPRRVARELLGKVVVRREGSTRLSGRIVEVEAYLGTEYPAAHSAAGNTARTAVLFGRPATLTFTSSMEIITVSMSLASRKATPGPFDSRAQPLSGIAEMAQARGIEIHGPKDLVKLTSGPGRLAQAFGITRTRDNGADLTCSRNSLWIGDDGYRARGIRPTPRIGITKAADKLLRYVIAGNAFVSGRRVGVK